MSSISIMNPIKQNLNPNEDCVTLSELIRNAENTPSAPLYPSLVIFKRILDNNSVRFEDKKIIAQLISDLFLKKDAYLNECRWGFINKLWSAVRNLFTLYSFATSSTIGQAMSREILKKSTPHLAVDTHTTHSQVSPSENYLQPRLAVRSLAKDRDSFSSSRSSTA